MLHYTGRGDENSSGDSGEGCEEEIEMMRIKGVTKKMSLAQNLKVSFLKNGMSCEAALLTVCSTHEYYKL